MASFLLSVAFMLAAADQPPTDTTQQQTAGPAATATATPAPEPKMVCKYEHVTGSRLSKQKVCRAEGAAGDDQSTALQRQLDRYADRAVQAPGLGN
jgi:predicted dinucleotide-binding enzyme